MLAPGQKLFQYDIIRPLGQGGFAAVFEAKDRLLDRHVAIKQLLLDRAKDKNSVKRFIQEARVIAALEHPNIVTIHALRVDENNFYMVMEYVAGGSLRQLLNKEGKLPVEQAVDITIGICEGLAKFHEQGIVHRDIKAENILITKNGLPKVIDFGIAHVPEAAGGLELTQVGFQPSTLLHSSPEQVHGLKLDARSDVYQIGELLYYMLMGRHYIDIDLLESTAVTHGGSNQFRSQARLYELLERVICEEKPTGLRTLWREVGALAGVVEKAMAKDRAERFTDAAEFAATLKTISINTTPVSTDEEDLGITDARAFNNRGLAHISTRNYEQAIIDYTRAIILEPNYPEAYINRSTAHLLMENYGQAVIDCNQAIELAPDFVATYVNRGIAHTGLRHYDQALDDYSKAIELDSDNTYAHYNRGNTYLWMGKYMEAIVEYTRTIEFDLEFVAAYINRGVAYNEIKESDAALADFSQAIRLNPDYVYAHFNRGTVYKEAGRHEKATEDYTKVIELNPQHKFAYDNRGDSYAALGDEDRASDDYTRIIIQTSSISPKRLSVARSMLMPTTPLDFLKRS
ncbi:MAG: tetratricopeptide repeat protein [Chloroflexota bacterium]